MGLKQIILEDTTNNDAYMVKTQQYWASMLDPYIKEDRTGFIDGVDLRLSVNDSDYEAMSTDEIYWENEGWIGTENYRISIGPEDIGLATGKGEFLPIPNATVKIALFEDDPQPVHYVVTVTAEQGSANIFGVPVSAMQSNVTVENDGFKGELKYLTEEDINDTWKQAWPEELQTGNFIALKFEVPEGPESVKVGFVNGTPLVEIINDPDRNGVFRVKSTSNVFKVVVDNDDENAQLYNFENITLDPKPEPPVPPTPKAIPDKTELERIAIALEKKAGIEYPDKGYLSDKTYLQRIADALEKEDE